MSTDEQSPDAPIANEKLAPYPNLRCLFGDSRKVIPPILEDGAAVLIDGPKEFRALKLALKLLGTGKPGVVFLHDFMAGRAERTFLERHWPGAFFSDHPDILERFSRLDDDGSGSDKWRRPRHSTFACLPAGLPAAYWILWLKIVHARNLSLAPEKLGGFMRRFVRK